MQTLDGHLLLSATDLSDFLACEHLASLKHRRALGEDIPTDVDAMSEILSGMGSDHEEACLVRYRSSGARVKEFDAARTLRAGSLAELEAAALETERAMRDGYDVIYQPFFLHGRWSGRADFLLRVEQPSALGAHSYEVADAKLARRVRPQAILQLCEYSAHVARIQERAPDLLHVLLGNGETHLYPLSDFSAYHASVRGRLEQAVDEGWHTYPERVSYCGACRFHTVCDRVRHDDDHLSIVARMRRDQVRRLRDSGITTMHGLAAAAVQTDVPGMVDSTFHTLRAQARLQAAGPLPDGRPRHELIDVRGPGFGLCALPAPDAGDVFFDMEGDPLARDDPLEYLFGALFQDAGGVARYRSWEGHDPSQEKAAFESFIDWLIARLDADPGMHVYHYADYERAALQRLMSRHGTRENEVDRLLRTEVLVDLYRVVYQGVRLSTESYGLKEVERLYMPRRQGEVADAASSMVMYERWRATGASPDARDRPLFDAIVAYNRVDCESTAGLRDWLERARDAFAREHDTLLPRPPAREQPETLDEELLTVEEVALRDALVSGLPDARSLRDGDQQARWLLAQLVAYHHRERRSAWWRYYRRLEMTEDELAEDRDSLGPLTHVATHDVTEKHRVDEYTFAPKEQHLTESVYDPLRMNKHGTRGVCTGTLVDVDTVRGILRLRRTVAQAELGHPLFVVPGGPMSTKVQAESLRTLANAVLSQGIDAPRGWRAGCDLLLRRTPRTVEGGALQHGDESAVVSALRVIGEASPVCLAVQGPPGAGKTYAAARIALARARHGPVGITALSHRAITNVLDEICTANAGSEVTVGQRAPDGSRCNSPGVVNLKDNAAVVHALDDESVQIVGATSFVFAREELTARFDTLIIDEAGQVSLADAIAMSRCARNLVLLGDPRQLAQVVQGIHPDGAAASGLEHFLGDEVTIAPDRGLFLEHTRRMCPPLTSFVSRAFYEGRLETDPACARQTLLTARGEVCGLRRHPVAHIGDRTSSLAEAAAVRDIVASLLGTRWRTRDGDVRPVTLQDILVVAPYNAHVACLTQHLPEDARVGTVDRFQGQEAAVSIFSMATSSTDDLPRNLEFLFSLNRLNVAVSRARCLAVLVSSPALTRAQCRTAAQMRLVNALCRFEQTAPLWEPLPSPDGSRVEQLQLTG